MTPPPSPHSGRPSPPLDGPGRVTGGPDRTVPADRDARGVFADRDVRRGPAPVRPPAGHTHGPGSVHGPGSTHGPGTVPAAGQASAEIGRAHV